MGVIVMLSLLRLVLLAGILVLASPASFGAGLNPFGPSGLPLTAQDYAAMAKATNPLLNDDSLPIGTSRDWRNASSGNQGDVTLVERFTYDYQGSKLPCRKLKYHVQVRNLADPYNLILQRCRIADGSWKIL
jgi:surface antigen